MRGGAATRLQRDRPPHCCKCGAHAARLCDRQDWAPPLPGLHRLWSWRSGPGCPRPGGAREFRRECPEAVRAGWALACAWNSTCCNPPSLLACTGLRQIMADVMGMEAAAVRIQFVSGTHAIACALFGVLRPGDELLSVAGRCGGPGLSGDREGLPAGRKWNQTRHTGFCPRMCCTCHFVGCTARIPACIHP